MFKVGCCGTTETYAAIAEMGYDYVELSARQLMLLSEQEFAHFLEEYRRIGFPCRGLNDFCGEELPLVGPKSDIARLRVYTQRLCQRGKALGIKTIGIGAPSARILPKGYSKEQADREILAFLDAVNPTAKENGIMLLMEAVHQYLCNYLNYTEEALAIVKSFGDKNVAMVLDYYHARVMGENMHLLAEIMSYVRHLHISTDLPGHERGFLREEDIPELSAYLEEAAAWGYSGGISVEALPKWLLNDGKHCAACMRGAVHSIQK